MKKIYLLILTAVFFAQCSKKTAEVAKSTAPAKVAPFRTTAPGAAPARPIELGKYNSFDMDNGLKVIVVENHKLPVVSYQLSLLNNPVMEGDQVGYVSFAGDMLSKGTKTKTKAQIDEEIDFVGASVSSSSGGLFGTSLKKHSGVVLGLMSDMLYNPSFPADELEKMRKQALSGLAQSKSNPNAIAGNIASVVNYGANHPYGEVRTEKTVKAINLDKCKEYYNTYFKPNNAYLVIVGDITPDEARAQAMQYFAQWQKGNVPSNSYATPTSPDKNKVIVGHKDAAVQSVIRVTYPIELKPGDPDIMAGMVMNSVLGGGVFSGRLMQNLRETKAYTYGAGSSLNSSDIIGSFNASASVRTAVTDSSVHEFMHELRRMTSDPPKPEDLQLVKNSMAGSFARSLESPQTIANFARNIFRYNLPKDYYDTYLNRLDAISLFDVQRAVNRFIKPSNANIVVVGDKDKISANLLKFDADGEIDYYDAFGMKLDMKAGSTPSDVKPENIIEDYISALGGRAKLQALKTLVMISDMTVMGQQATVTQKHSMPSKFSSVIAIGGNPMVIQVVNGDKALLSQMGQKKVIAKGDPMFNDLASGVNPFPQLDYAANGVKLALKGTEEIEGKKCYKVETTKKDGSVVLEYYDIKSNLLLKTSENKSQGENSTTLAYTFSDYQAVDGVMIPFKVVIEGMMPMALETKITSAKINVPLEDSDFKVE
jgi:zinc protease